MKETQIIIVKDASDTAETKFCGLNGKNYSIPVGKAIWIPSDLYEYALSKGCLKDRVQKLGER